MSELLPTPCASRSGSNQSLSPGAARRPSLDGIATLMPTPTARDHKGRNQRDDASCLPGALLPTPRASRGASTTETAYALGGERSDADRPQGQVLLPTPAASDSTGGGRHPDARKGHSSQIIDTALLHGTTAWGKYGPAISRWEELTRPAPSPTEPNRNGKPRLNAAFPEWMMGWPAGWVTDVPGVSRNDALRIVGNGVCPQQAAYALRWLLSAFRTAS